MWKIPFTKKHFGFRDPNSIEVNKQVFEETVALDKKFKHIRPILDPVEVIGDDEVLIPMQPMPLQILYDVSRYSDILRTIHQNLRKEIFRHGYEVKENFAVRCESCGKEYENYTDECDECDGTDMIEPNIEQKKLLTKYLKEVNDNGQDIIQVYEEINDDLEKVDDSYLLCVKDYYWKDEKEMVGAVPVEFIRTDPRYIKLIADKTGRPGYNAAGKKVWVCLEHREQLQIENETCDKCDRTLFPAHFRVDNLGYAGSAGSGVVGNSGQYIYYAKDEIKHQSKYSPSLTYGFSVIYAVWMKVVTLMNMDNYMKDYYAKQRPPRGLLFVNTPNMNSLEKAWNWMLDEFKKNPHQIPPIAIENPIGSKGKLVEFIDFMKSMDEMQYTETRNEMRRQVGAVYGVMPIFQGDISTSGGLNNEGLQITVTNRSVKDGQGIFNDGFNPWVVEQLKVTDYHFELLPNEEQDLMAKEEVFGKKIDNALKMQQMGFDVSMNEDEDFEYEPIDEPVEPADPMGGMGGFGGSSPFGGSGGSLEEKPAAQGAAPNQNFSGAPTKSMKKGLYTIVQLPGNPMVTITNPDGSRQTIPLKDVPAFKSKVEKEGGAVTTGTSGVFNPVHQPRKKRK